MCLYFFDQCKEWGFLFTGDYGDLVVDHRAMLLEKRPVYKACVSVTEVIKRIIMRSLPQ